MKNLKGVTITNDSILINLNELTKDKNFSIDKLARLRNDYLLSRIDNLMSINAVNHLAIKFENKPEDFGTLKLSEAPADMTIEEFRNRNAMKEVFEDLEHKITRALSEHPMPSDDQLKEILKKEYPDFTDTDMKNILSMEYDLLDSYGYEKIQNLDSIASLVAATKKQKYVFA